MRPSSAFVAGLVAVGVCAPLRAETVVEYYNATLDHYFITPLADEISALDSGRIVGWARTGLTFDASATPGTGLSPVCRFYIPPVHGDSHFLSASPAECADVLAKVGADPNFSGYIEETPAEFYIALPDAATGACPPGTAPVYRLWNGRADSNHRYTADVATRDTMIARGYIPEGYGAAGVGMCTTHASLGRVQQVRVTDRSPFPAGCDGAPQPLNAIAYLGAEVEPQIAVDPRDPAHLIGVWQQDRWSDGGARGLRTGYSFDAGLTWTLTQAAFTHCTGGNAGNGGDYPRASDPWLSIGPDGIAYQVAIAFIGDSLAPGSSSAVLASRSTDGGRTWSAPSALIRDADTFFNDKDSVTADPTQAGTAYATWDRLVLNGSGPAYFTRTTDGGTTWEVPRSIYDPGNNNQTLNNQIVVVSAPGGGATLVDFFTEFDVGQNNSITHHLALVRSTDRGATWSGPIFVSDIHAVGTYDPQDPTRLLRDGANLGSFASGPGGVLVAVWQDGRFSGGIRDGIAFARSTDGGSTWSAPVQVNRVSAVQALLPAVAIAPDGTIGILYYDMRNDTADPATLFVDAWLITSPDGTTWSERHVAGPFDFNRAPIAEGGLFIGDYQALAAASGEFAAYFVQTTNVAGDATDVFASLYSSGAAAVKAQFRAREALAFPLTPQWRAKIDASVQKTLRERLIGRLPTPIPAPPR
ncbi:MAG TPA: hypothetical protein VL654_09345 [Casimicrobiaceae bacterium]|nr:hypothetical protein [Casimicrobiaceae bacterium]